MKIGTGEGEAPQRRLSEELVEILARGARSLVMRSGERVVAELGRREGVPIVMRGRVRVSRVLADGSDLMLYRLEDHEPCAASALAALSGRDWTFAVGAEVDSRVVVAPSSHFCSTHDARADLRSCVTHALADRMDAVLRLAEWTSRLPLETRLADLLIEEGPELDSSHQELANRLGCARETVSRVLATLEAEGLVERGYRKLVVRDVEALRSRGGGLESDE